MARATRRAAAVLLAGVIVFMANPAYATGPQYPSAGTPWVYISHCQGMLGEATDTQTATLYARTTINMACISGTTEIIYIDDYGNEKSIRASVVTGSSWTDDDDAIMNRTTLGIKRSNYRSIVEIYATINGYGTTRSCMIFFNPTYTDCG